MAALHNGMTQSARIVCCLIFGALTLSFSPQAQTEGTGAQNVMSACPVREPITLAGVLHANAWGRAVSADTFTQRELTEGGQGTEKTEVRVLYDGEKP